MFANFDLAASSSTQPSSAQKRKLALEPGVDIFQLPQLQTCKIQLFVLFILKPQPNPNAQISHLLFLAGFCSSAISKTCQPVSQQTKEATNQCELVVTVVRKDEALFSSSSSFVFLLVVLFHSLLYVVMGQVNVNDITGGLAWPG